MTIRSQWLILVLLLGIWAGVAFWIMAAAPEPQRVPLAYVTGKADRAKVSRPQAGAGLKVNLDLLAAGRRRTEEAFVAPKNIFAPLQTEKEKMALTRAKRRTPAPTTAPVVTAPAVPQPPSPEELAAQAARQALAQFRYLGDLSRDGKQQAFISNGKDLYIVLSDEPIEQRELVKTV